MHRRLASLIFCCAVTTACEGATHSDILPGEQGGNGDESAEPAAAQTDQVGGDAVKVLAQARDDATLPGIGDGETGGRGATGPGGFRDAGVVFPESGRAPSAAAPTSTGRGDFAGSSDAVSGGARASGGAPAPATSPTSTPSGVSRPVADPAIAPPRGGAPLPRPPVVPPQLEPRPGTLTAGTWDDNRNFRFFEQYRNSVAQSLTGILPFSDEEFQRANELSKQPTGPRTRLDIALVVDTTGSMGDEIRYLQAEFIAISRAIESAYPQSEQRWALVTYRDEGDEYVARYFDFRTDPSAFREKFAAQYAAGGGDFPEAPQAAFAILNQFAWRTGRDVARLAFWVADAPHHPQFAGALAKSVRDSRDLGIHVYPVASSGVDELTELTMRSTAQLTLGRYLFLTDDSRVGNSHKEPSIPCYFVTKLDDALLRAVSIEMTGVYREPDPQKVVRVQGNPSRGSCTLSSGQTVQAF